jgi:hypothetical protein
MRIKALTTFLHGRKRFERDDVRTVPDADAAYFLAHGWAVEAVEDAAAAVEPAAGAVQLQPDNGVIGVVSEE